MTPVYGPTVFFPKRRRPRWNLVGNVFCPRGTDQSPDISAGGCRSWKRDSQPAGGVGYTAFCSFCGPSFYYNLTAITPSAQPAAGLVIRTPTLADTTDMISLGCAPMLAEHLPELEVVVGTLGGRGRRGQRR